MADVGRRTPEMKPSAAVAVHAMIAIATATTLAVSYGLLSVYALHNVDGKFGAAGTVQLLGLMAAISSSVAAAGSGLFHFLWLRRTTRVRPAVTLWSGVVVGSLLALVHKLILFHAPLLPGVSDWQQQCLYFVVLGYVLHWASVPLIKVVGAQQSVAADRREDAAPAER